MGTPDPFGGTSAETVDDADRLRIVHEDEVVLVDVDLTCVQLLEPRELVALGRRQPLRVALQRVVDRLCRREERLRPLDDPPFDREPGVLHQRDERVLDLRNAASERRRRELEHTRACERSGELADLVHQPTGRNRRVIRK